MRTPLKLVTYDTVETITLTVSQMLSLHSALFDAQNWNEEHGLPLTAEGIQELRKHIEAQTNELVDEADRKCVAYLKAMREARDNSTDDQGPRENDSTGAA